MNKYFALMLAVSSLSTVVYADSSIEQDNYLEIKSEYAKADSELNNILDSKFKSIRMKVLNFTAKGSQKIFTLENRNLRGLK